ncbi:MAG: TIGR02281 family clan AA aspartic protease [Gammaproteobacteria bacterium]
MTLSRYLLRLLVLGLLLHQPPVFAGLDVRVVGLFADRAVLLVEGQQHLLKVGQTSPEGIKLVSATSDHAILLIDGEQVSARLDGRVSAVKRPATADEVQVWRNTTGMYTTVGSINGLPVSFLVDTGATQVAMNAAQARRLGIDYHVTGSPAEVTTASGVERAWLVMLDSVKVGELEVRNVPAVVLEGAQPKVTLLGMSFLGRMEISNDGHLMTLKKKY